MSDAVARILTEVEQLSESEREELADRLAEYLLQISREVQTAQIAEVRTRIQQLESGEVSVVPGEEAMRRVRSLIEVARSHRVIR